MKRLILCFTIVLLAALSAPPGHARSVAIAASTAAATAAIAATTAMAARPSPGAVQGAVQVTSTVDWAEVGYLVCNSGLSQTRGCAKAMQWGKPVNIEPWIIWMRRHVGPEARFMGMVRGYGGEVTLYWGKEANHAGD